MMFEEIQPRSKNKQFWKRKKISIAGARSQSGWTYLLSRRPRTRYDVIQSHLKFGYFKKKLFTVESGATWGRCAKLCKWTTALPSRLCKASNIFTVGGFFERECPWTWSALRVRYWKPSKDFRLLGPDGKIKNVNRSGKQRSFFS